MTAQFISKQRIISAVSRTKRWFLSLDIGNKILVSSVAVAMLLGAVGMATVGLGGPTRVVVAQAGTETDVPLEMHKTLTVNEPIAYTTSTVDDSSLSEGTTQVRTPGVDGVRVKTYDVTYENGREVSRVMVSEMVVQEPTQEIVAKGVARSYDRDDEPFHWRMPECEKKRGRLVCDIR